MNAVATTSPAEAFRDGAAGLLHAVADMSLHDLVDEFQRLTLAVEAGKTTVEVGGYPQAKWSDGAKLAAKQRGLVNGAAKARFGISFDTYDRGDNDDIPF
jgi:hypothetical protein